jgi:hypothetical protein
MLMQGLDPAAVSGRLGHADVAFTMRTDMHPQADALKKGGRCWRRSWGTASEPVHEHLPHPDAEFPGEMPQFVPIL